MARPTSNAAHPDRTTLTAFLQGRLEPERQAEVELHVLTCDACCNALRLAPEDTLVDRIRDAVTPQLDAPATNGARDASPQLDVPRPDVPPTDEAHPASGVDLRDIPAALVDHARYKVLRVLGRGGMGVVYLAEHRLMERFVALKVIDPKLLRHSTALERFRFEVKAAARLAHPNIVAAYDAEQVGDLHVLVMEYVDGTDLAALVRDRGPLGIQHASHYVRQAAIGLEHALKKGMIHRDIKPQNLMLTRQGTVKVLDFGLARIAWEEQAIQVESRAMQPTEEKAPELTVAGSMLGTPDYIAPEQIRDARSADIRADIYSLGCTLYFLLTGQPPFPRGTLADKLTGHVARAPRPIREIRGSVPGELAEIVSRMMAKDPNDRFATPAEVAQALAPFAKAEYKAAAEKQGNEGQASEKLPTPVPVAPAPATPAPVATAHAASTLLAPVDSPPILAAAPIPIAGTNAAVPAGGPIPIVSSAVAPHPAVSSSIAAGRPQREAISRSSPRLLERRRITARQMAIAIGGVLALVGCVALAVSRSGRDKPGANRESYAADADVKHSTSQGDTKTGKPGNAKAGTNSSANSSTAPAAATRAPVRSEGARIAMVVAHQNFWYPDFVPVKRVFDEAGAKVTIASSAIGLATPDPRSAGEPVEADVAVHDLSADKFDAIVICGGEGVSEFYNTEPAGRDLKRLLADMLREGKCVSALCAGPAVLADADILKGVEVTGFSSIKPKLAARGAVYVDEPVKTSDQIVTARNWEYADEFARTVLEWLANNRR